MKRLALPFLIALALWATTLAMPAVSPVLAANRAAPAAQATYETNEMELNVHYRYENVETKAVVEFWVEEGLPFQTPVYYQGTGIFGEPEKVYVWGYTLPGTSGADAITFRWSSPADDQVWFTLNRSRWKPI